MISFLENKDIDREAWDACVEASPFETIYSYSWYLDLVAPGWNALVKGGYEYILPLTESRKWGFRMLLQPVLAQQLGVFSRGPVEQGIAEELFSWLSGRYRYADICVNSGNTSFPENFRSKKRDNYVIDLENPGEYNQNTRRNLQKALDLPFELKIISTEEYMGLKYRPGRRKGIPWKYMERIFDGLSKMGRAEIFGLLLEEELQSAAILAYSNSRAIYLNGCTNPRGKENRAMFLLMHQLIRHASRKAPLFDFEGSSIPGIARFFQGFGGENRPYCRLVFRKFPFDLIRR